MFPDSITILLPKWLQSFVDSSNSDFSTTEKRMEFVLSLARESIRQKSGGPFAAAVFNCTTNELIAPGLNLVVSQCCSSAHAEIVALSLAQQTLRRFDLSDNGMYQYELVASTAPCAMCLGAIPWSGITRLVCGAQDEDARRIGFDEGAKVTDWIEQLTKRGIKVSVDVCRKQSIDILNEYATSAGLIYNSKK